MRTKRIRAEIAALAAVAICCVVTASLCYSQTPANTPTLLYYTSSTGVVNGLPANLLLPENSDQLDGFGLSAMYYPHICKIWADIFVRHADGTEIQIGDNVAYWSSSDDYFSGYVYCSWTCPATELAVTDSIRIQEWMQLGTVQNSADFTTNQLGAIALKQSTWTFRRYLTKEIVKYYTDFNFSYGHSAYASYIDGIALWPNLPCRMNFQPASSTTPAGYLPADTEAYDEARSYGWR